MYQVYGLPLASDYELTVRAVVPVAGACCMKTRSIFLQISNQVNKVRVKYQIRE